MSLQEPNTQRPWQKKAWVQWLAVAIGVLPYMIAFLFPQLAQPLNVKDTLLGIVIWSIIIVVILLLLRFLCGERIRDLNLQAGTWWKDILAGIGLSALTLTILITLSETVSRLFPGPRDFVAVDFFNEIFQNSWLFALWIGPGILIAAGIGEELVRAFVLTRLWKLSSNTAWRWIAIFLYAVVFGLGHFYEGPTGAIIAGIYSLIMSAYYLRFGRFTVLMIAHYLNDVALFALFYIVANT
jgi:membrane protease YdiL (CAAX protease family)